jgi:hypothetical protein
LYAKEDTEYIQTYQDLPFYEKAYREVLVQVDRVAVPLLRAAKKLRFGPDYQYPQTTKVIIDIESPEDLKNLPEDVKQQFITRRGNEKPKS